MIKLWRSLRQQVGRRGAFLLYLALLDLIYGFALANPTEQSVRNPTTIFLIGIMPLIIWAALWAVVGLACLFYAFRRKDAIGYAAAMSIKAFWAIVFLLGWITGEVERGYLSAVIWGAFVVLLLIIAGWRENPEEVEE